MNSGLDADLVLIELAVNDDFNPDTFASTESLLRSLLNLPNSPAVIFVDAFALQTARSQRMSLNGGDAHSHLAVRYDVPQISLRAAVLTAMMDEPGLVVPWFNHDTRHIAQPMHEMLGGMVTAYLQEERCRLARGGWAAERRAWEAKEGSGMWPSMRTLGQVPKVCAR